MEKGENVKSEKQVYDKRVMANFLRDTDLSRKNEGSTNIYVNPYTNALNPIDIENSDELFLLIDNCDDDRDSGVHVEYGQYILNQKCNASMKAKLSHKVIPNTMLNYQETPKRKLYSKKQKEKLRKNNLNSRLSKNDLTLQMIPTKIDKSCSRYDIIRLEILFRMSDMNKLLKTEEELVRTLAKGSAQYRAQNEIYTAKVGLEMRIEQVQANLGFFAKEIIKNELQLFEIKMEIKQKQGIIRNLHRMLKEEETLYGHVGDGFIIDDRFLMETEKIAEKCLSQDKDICFVDNIYEFCDNNSSMIV